MNSGGQPNAEDTMTAIPLSLSRCHSWIQGGG